MVAAIEETGARPLQFSIVMGVGGGMAMTRENLLSIVRRMPAVSAWQMIAIGRANLATTARRARHLGLETSVETEEEAGS